MSKRVFAVLFWPLLAAWAIWVLHVPGMALAQTSNGVPPPQSPPSSFADAVAVAQLRAERIAYLTEHPIDPEQFVLATATGRYGVKVSPGCPASFAPWQTVTVGGIYETLDRAIELRQPGDLYMGIGIGAGHTWCALSQAVLLDHTPCFGDGVCDVRYEIPE